MKDIFSAAILSLASLFFVFPQASAQDYKEKFAENQIISAVSKYDDNQFPEAAAILKEVIKTAPDNDAAHFYLGLTEFCMNNIGAAESELKTAVALDSSNFWYRYRLAMVYSAAGKEELTLAMMEDMVRLPETRVMKAV